MATALIHMHHLNKFEEAAVIAARIGASTMGFFTKNTDGNGLGGETDDNGSIINSVEPGQFNELPEGVSLEMFDAKYPHEVFDPFVKRALKAIASGLNVSYPMLASDLSDVNGEIFRSDCLQTFDGHGNHLGVGFRAAETDQFNPGLKHLARFAQLLLGVPEDAATVTEPEGQWHLAHAGCSDTGDLWSNIRGESNQATCLAVVKTKGSFAKIRSQPQLKDRQIF
jgi:hypothetical protein